MADEDPLTSNAEPGAKPPLTSTAAEPESAPDADLSTSPQPTLEEVIAERDRYKAAAKGSDKLSKEWQQEKERRERLEWQLQQLQQQIPAAQPQPKPAEPTDEELAEQLNAAVLDVDKSRTGRILGEIQARAQRRSEEAIMGRIGQAVTYNQQQQSYGGYLAEMGILPNTPIHQRTIVLLQEMQNNPKYSFTGGNQAWLTTIAAERARAEMGLSKTNAMETIKMETSASAGSESGSKGDGAPPGKVTTKSDAIYLTAEEKRVAAKMYGGSVAEAEKRYWNNMNPGLREARISARKAIV